MKKKVEVEAEEKAVEKFCPILVLAGKKDTACKKRDCEWYNTMCKSCAVKLI